MLPVAVACCDSDGLASPLGSVLQPERFAGSVAAGAAAVDADPAVGGAAVTGAGDEAAVGGAAAGAVGAQARDDGAQARNRLIISGIGTRSG